MESDLVGVQAIKFVFLIQLMELLSIVQVKLIYISVAVQMHSLATQQEQIVQHVVGVQTGGN